MSITNSQNLLKGSLVCCSLWGRKELDDLATEQQQLLPHLTISCLLPSQLYFLLQGRTETMLRFVYTELPNRAASKQMKCPYWLYALEFVCMFVFAKDILYILTKTNKSPNIKHLYGEKWASIVSQMVKNLSGNVGDLGSIPGLGRFPWRRVWQPTPVFLPRESPWTEEPGATVPGVAKSWTWLSDFAHGEKHNFSVLIVVTMQYIDCCTYYCIKY